MMGFGFIGMLLGGLLLLGLLALVVVGAVLAARGPSHGSEPSRSSQEEYAKAKVMALLAERYARGEIDDAEYRTKKCELG